MIWIFDLILDFSKEMHPKCGNIRKVANMSLIFLAHFYVFCGLHVSLLAGNLHV